MSPRIGTFIISLDFELLWGIRDFADGRMAESVLPTRQVVPGLLNLFRQYEIHATWATVGFLFFESRAELIKSVPHRKPAYVDRALSPYEDLSVELGENEQTDPLHFAPLLIRQILDTPNQELGTHTFSHYYCLEAGQTPEDFEHDLMSAFAAAAMYQHELKSIVFPRNQYSDGYLEVCAQRGIIAYRGNESIWFRQSQNRETHRQWHRRLMRLADAYINISGSNSYPIPVGTGLPINLPASRYLRTYSRRLRILEPLRLRRILSAMTEAAQKGEIFHLWWHPEDFSTNMEKNFKILESILLHYQKLNRSVGMQSRTMGEIAKQILGDE